MAIGFPEGEEVVSQFDLAELNYTEELEVEVDGGYIRARRPAAYQNSGKQAAWCRRFLELTPNLARLCGYYISEGTLGSEREYVRFTFGKHETEYQQDVIQLCSEIFGIQPARVESRHGSWVQIDLYNRVVANWFFQNFGSHSYGKRIPLWLQFSPPEIQEAFLIGVMRGDGLFYEREHTIQGRRSPKVFRSLRITLANPGLVHQIWQMLWRLGYEPAVRPVDTRYVTENARPTEQVSLPPLQSRSLVEKAFGIFLPAPDSRYLRPNTERRNGAVFLPVRSIERKMFSGTVYNCEVAEDHTYVAEGIVVHNCFVLPVSDDMGRRDDGIFQTLRNMALIHQTGGGTGFSFSRLRPKETVVISSGGKATGPVGFMRVYDLACEIVSQGGTRRGANMGVLRVDHPDIEEFITCKTDEHAINNFNISVGVTDAFMRAVEDDEEWELRFPDVLHPAYRTFNGTLEEAEQAGIPIKVYRKVRARDLFDRIVRQAHRNGEPGILFLDAMNRANPCPHLGAYEATNPCGEQPLLPYENCCLGSINLARHVRVDGDGRAVIDWDLLQETVGQAVRFLDDVVDANAYVPAIPQLKEAAQRTRRIGLGIMALGDVMYMLGVRYGSEESLELASQIMEFIRYHAMQASIALARERGPFPAIRGSVYDPEDLRWTPPTPLVPYTRLEKWGRPPLDWGEILDGIRQYGIRNAAQLTIAPTGTIATVAGCEAYGCEPVYALAYTRKVHDDGREIELRYVSPLFLQALERAGIDEPTREEILEQVLFTGSCQDVPEVPPEIRHVFVVAGDIPAEEHVRMQAALQAFVDAAISKTINFPADATPEDVARAYMLAWKLGCKGLTVYVTGSREKVVLETEAVRKAREAQAGAGGRISPTASPLVPVRPRPHILQGQTYRIQTPLGTAYVTVNCNGEGEPFEVFLNVGKAGSDTAAVAEAIGRLISLILRVPSPLPARRRLQQVVRQLRGIGGGRPTGFGRDRVQSLPDGVAQVLAEFLGLEAPPEHPATAQLPLFPLGDLCPECGHATLVNEEGCRRCYTCGYSEC